MEGYNIYRDIAERTDGDIYIGVVGPVRTGKSTFIKKFMDMLVLPNIQNENHRERARDELPQSAAGRTIMTTEPKFIPNQAVEISLGNNATFKVRMIDSVGYIVNGALGYIENEQPRMVQTPWFENEISFNEAAEIGTRKVIAEHSTIGIVMTTDGSITEIGRDEYVEAEMRVVKELKEINKPFIVILNSIDPYSHATQALRGELEEKYGVPIMTLNCAQMDVKDINSIMELVLFEFPVREIGINIPGWIDSLDTAHYLKEGVYETIRDSMEGVEKIRHVRVAAEKISNYEYIASSAIEHIELGSGKVSMNVQSAEGLFYKVVGENTGFEIDGEDTLIKLLTELSVVKRNYDKVSIALEQVSRTGYGIVSPTIDELTLEEPEIVRQGNRFGVRLKASAPSIHMIRADIETDVLQYKMTFSLHRERSAVAYDITYDIAA